MSEISLRASELADESTAQSHEHICCILTTEYDMSLPEQRTREFMKEYMTCQQTVTRSCAKLIA